MFGPVFLKETRLSPIRGELRRGASLIVRWPVCFEPHALQSACQTTPTACEHVCLYRPSAHSIPLGPLAGAPAIVAPRPWDRQAVGLAALGGGFRRQLP